MRGRPRPVHLERDRVTHQFSSIVAWVLCAAIAGILNGCAAPDRTPEQRPIATDATTAYGSCSITVRLIGLDPRRGEGPVRIALWNSDTNFMNDGRWLRGESIPIANADRGAVFEGLPPGRYAISAFHDTRSAGRLRQGAFGIPIDPWAISNAGASITPPAWRTASFEVTDAGVVVELDFLHRPRQSP